MICSIEKMKLLARSVLMSVFVLGLGQEVCGMSGGKEQNKKRDPLDLTYLKTCGVGVGSKKKNKNKTHTSVNQQVYNPENDQNNDEVPANRNESNVINFRTYEDILGYVRRMTGGEEHIWSGRRWEEFNTWIYHNVRQFRGAIAGHTIGKHFFSDNGKHPGAPTRGISSYFYGRIDDCLERILNSLVVDPTRGINLMEGVADVDRLGYGYYNGQTREGDSYEVVTFDVAINVRRDVNIAWERVYRDGHTEHHARCNQVTIRYILTDDLQWRVVSIWPKN